MSRKPRIPMIQRLAAHWGVSFVVIWLLLMIGWGATGLIGGDWRSRPVSLPSVEHVDFEAMLKPFVDAFDSSADGVVVLDPEAAMWRDRPQHDASSSVDHARFSVRIKSPQEAVIEAATSTASGSLGWRTPWVRWHCTAHHELTAPDGQFVVAKPASIETRPHVEGDKLHVTWLHGPASSHALILEIDWVAVVGWLLLTQGLTLLVMAWVERRVERQQERRRLDGRCIRCGHSMAEESSAHCPACGADQPSLGMAPLTRRPGAMLLSRSSRFITCTIVLLLIGGATAAIVEQDPASELAEQWRGSAYASGSTFGPTSRNAVEVVEHVSYGWPLVLRDRLQTRQVESDNSAGGRIADSDVLPLDSRYALQMTHFASTTGIHSGEGLFLGGWLVLLCASQLASIILLMLWALARAVRRKRISRRRAILEAS